jgi:hypothetical protein
MNVECVSESKYNHFVTMFTLDRTTEREEHRCLIAHRMHHFLENSQLFHSVCMNLSTIQRAKQREDLAENMAMVTHNRFTRSKGLQNDHFTY